MPEIKQRFQMPNSLKSPKMSIIEDIQTVFAKDPAARSTLEVILCYPGLHALGIYSIPRRE